MDDLLLFALAGFCASFVDGALGMGFGPTSSTVLLSSGLSPASVSASVNLVKVATGVASALSHWRFQNIDRGLVLRLLIPGVIGAVIGVTVLSNVNGATLKPILSGLLIVMGLRILFRFARALPTTAPATAGETEDAPAPSGMPVFDRRGLEVVAACGGITNGLVGAWGPVVTPFLLHRGLAPRFAIGSVNTAEVAVAAASATSVFIALGRGMVELSVVIAMLVGGVVAAPLAAWAIRFIRARVMGIAVAALLLITNARELIGWARLENGAVFYAGIALLVALAAFFPRLSNRVAARRSVSPTLAAPLSAANEQ